MDINLEGQKFRESIEQQINDTNLPGIVVYLTLKDIFLEVEQKYYSLLNQMAIKNPIVVEAADSKNKDEGGGES